MITKTGEHMVKTGFLGAAINAGKTLWNVGGKAMGPLMTGLMAWQYGNELASGESSLGEVAGSAAGGYAGWKGVDGLLKKAPGPLRLVGGLVGGMAGDIAGRAIGGLAPIWKRKPQTAQQYMGRNAQQMQAQQYDAGPASHIIPTLQRSSQTTYY